jgi:hypothetical protein
MHINTPNPKVIVFLDCDGVLNSNIDFRREVLETDPLNPGSVNLFKEIQEETNCTVVLSSTWRKHAEAVAKLRNHGIVIHDATPVIYTGRGVEINAWLNWYCKEKSLERTDLTFAILDDDVSDIVSEQDLKPFVFRTYMDKGGLTNDVADLVKQHLKTALAVKSTFTYSKKGFAAVHRGDGILLNTVCANKMASMKSWLSYHRNMLVDVYHPKTTDEKVQQLFDHHSEDIVKVVEVEVKITDRDYMCGR